MARATTIPVRVKQKRPIEKFIYLVAIIEPLMSLPQVIQIYKNKSAEDVSLLTWVGYEAMALIWIWYGVVVKDKSIILYQTLFFLIDGSLMVGAILYGAQWI